MKPELIEALALLAKRLCSGPCDDSSHLAEHAALATIQAALAEHETVFDVGDNIRSRVTLTNGVITAVTWTARYSWRAYNGYGFVNPARDLLPFTPVYQCKHCLHLFAQGEEREFPEWQHELCGGLVVELPAKESPHA